MGSGAVLNPVQVVALALLQGVTELFPVSSLGHAVVVPHLLGWAVDERSDAFLPFLVGLHLGTAVALLLYFRSDWWAFVLGVVRPAGSGSDPERRVLLLVVLGTIPAALAGLVLEKRLTALFGSPRTAAAFLVVNGAVLACGEWLRRRRRTGDLAALTPTQAVVVGLAQALALLPGISRSGVTLAGGLLVGLTHEAAARFAFLLATPVILGAAVLELPKLARPDLRPDLGPAALGAVVAGVAAYASTWFLMRYFRQHEADALLPFAAYCALAGAAAFVLG